MQLFWSSDFCASCRLVIGSCGDSIRCFLLDDFFEDLQRLSVNLMFK